ncbi:RAVE protein 1 C terminal-domain-containing protein [Peziza echinospora]|nr:RAVE protein 1 C terminal-domain-containing protein [Peziza echinospora]
MRTRTVLPGRPQATLQAVCTGEWGRLRLVAYVSGKTLVILGGVDEILQTIYHDGGDLTAVAIDEQSGKFAVASGNQVLVYGPSGYDEGSLSWIFQSSFKLDTEDGNVNSICWGSDDEVLVGSNSLSLWETCSEKVHVLWRKPLASAVKLAVFSYNDTLVSSIGFNDRLVKVWERLSFGSDDVQFGFSYLPHPRAVTNLHWRRPFHREETIDSVLYTLCVDSILRIWAPVHSQDQGVLHLWSAIDLQGSIPMALPESSSESDRKAADKHAKGPSPRHVFVIDSKVFTGATEAAVRTAGTSEKQVETLRKLTELAARNPEICVIFDDEGRMSALGLDNVGSKNHKPTNVFNIVTTQRSELMAGMEGADGERFVQFLPYYSGKQESGGLVLLAHFYDGRIHWFDARLDEFLDPAPRKHRLNLRGTWSGHSTAITAFRRTKNGKAILSSSDNGEHYVWVQSKTNDATSLKRQSELLSSDEVLHAVLMDTGKLAITIHNSHVTLWDTSFQAAREIGRSDFTVEGKVLCLLLLPEYDDVSREFHVVAVTSKMKGVAWEIKSPTIAHNPLPDTEPLIRQYATFDLGEMEEHHKLLAVDPVGWHATLSGTLDRFSREVVISITASGLLRSWSARVATATSDIQWLSTFTVDTGIASASIIRASSLGKVAIVGADRNDLSIWATRSAQLEYQMQFGKDEVIRDLDWACTPDSQSILAVGFSHRVLLLSQLRYDYLQGGASWAPFREIKIREYNPHPIGDSIWLEDGGLVIGTGNQIYIITRKIEHPDEFSKPLKGIAHKSSNTDIFDIVSHLNGPVPVYHPQFLQQCILAGRTKLVERILVGLHKELRNYHEELPLDNFLDIPIEAFIDPDGEEAILQARNTNAGTYFENYAHEDELSTFGEPLAASLSELFTKIPIPHLTGSEQMMLASITECVAQVSKQRRSIDENGERYLLFFKHHLLGRDRRIRVQPGNEKGLSWREIVWAFHSVSQEILVDMVGNTHKGKMLWSGARDSGLFMWLRDLQSVRNQWEILARNHYAKSEDKNPIDCSLHYLALRKKNVLLGLWRIAHWNREQSFTHKFLSNNFSEPRWRTAAKKNAFALLGKQRYEYAAAFFLLADSLQDSVSVIFSQMEDMQLAIAVARVYEGDDGPVLKWLLEEKVVPVAVREGNRWLATWAFWMLKRRDLAVRAIVEPLHTLLPSPNTPSSPILESHLYLASDPALIILYKLLRDKTTQTLRGLRKISPVTEFEFVLHTARLYDRMGCDLLALELVKNWVFLSKSEDVLAMPLRKVDIVAPGARAKRGRRGSVTITDELQELQRRGSGGWGAGGGGGFGGSVGGGGGESSVKTPVAEDFGMRPGVTTEHGAIVNTAASSLLDKWGDDAYGQGGSGGEGGGGGGGEAGGGESKRVLVKPPASVFEEPDMSWAFG